LQQGERLSAVRNKKCHIILLQFGDCITARLYEFCVSTAASSILRARIIIQWINA
jgi:hypothetical protein